MNIRGKAIIGSGCGALNRESLHRMDATRQPNRNLFLARMLRTLT